MKKCFTFVLTIVLLFVLAACNNTNDSAINQTPALTSNTTPSLSTDASTPAPEPTAESTPEPTQEPTPVPAFESDVFPIIYEAYEKTYTYTGYKIGTNDEGKTTVTLYGSGNQLEGPINEWNGVPFVEILANGETYSWDNIGNGEAMLYTFDTTETPEKIILTQGNTGDMLAEFIVANEPQS